MWAGFNYKGVSYLILAYYVTLVLRFLMRDGAAVTNGLVWSPANGPLAGSVYCIGGGMCTFEAADGGPEIIARCSLRQSPSERGGFVRGWDPLTSAR
jgi:hypothetical protein